MHLDVLITHLATTTTANTTIATQISQSGNILSKQGLGVFCSFIHVDIKTSDYTLTPMLALSTLQFAHSCAASAHCFHFNRDQKVHKGVAAAAQLTLKASHPQAVKMLHFKLQVQMWPE